MCGHVFRLTEKAEREREGPEFKNCEGNGHKVTQPEQQKQEGFLPGEQACQGFACVARFHARYMYESYIDRIHYGKW